MNSYIFSAIAIVLAAQCALAQYQQQGYGGNSYGYQQTKMAPKPQTYGTHEQSAGYEQQQQYGASSYKAPSSAAVSSYDERASGYGKQASGYGQQASGYGQQAASTNYAKPAARYEEPYHPPTPFAWGYDINDGYGGAQYHKENGDEYGKRTGSYGYTDAYGVYRQVDYVADEHGFRATVKTNEPGTANEAPADVEWHAYEPPSNYYAGNTNSYSAPAAKSSYGSSSSSYSAPAANSYAAPQQTYQSSSSYSAGPAKTAHQQSTYQRSSYGAPARQTYQRPASYEQSAQYASSVIVPVYQKAAINKPLAAVPAKRH